jgi:hypothetical protein
LRGREIAASVIQKGGGDFNLTELLRELEDEMQSASANLSSNVPRCSATRLWK